MRSQLAMYRAGRPFAGDCIAHPSGWAMQITRVVCRSHVAFDGVGCIWLVEGVDNWGEVREVEFEQWATKDYLDWKLANWDKLRRCPSWIVGRAACWGWFPSTAGWVV